MPYSPTVFLILHLQSGQPVGTLHKSKQGVYSRPTIRASRLCTYPRECYANAYISRMKRFGRELLAIQGQVLEKTHPNFFK